MRGWVKLHRQTLNSSIFDNPHLLKMWMWCLLKASHKDHKQMIGLDEIELKEGQFVTGRNKGSTELNVNPSTWYKHIKALEKMGMVELESNNKMTVVNVVNWGLYQGNESEKEQQNNNKRTTKEQQSNTNKNGKKDKNEKKEPIVTSPKFNEETIEFQLADMLYQKILLNDDKTKKPNLYKWAEHIDKLIRLDKRSVEDIKSVINYATSDSFWMSNVLSTNKLRQQFPKLILKVKEESNGGRNNSNFKQVKGSIEEVGNDIAKRAGVISL